MYKHERRKTFFESKPYNFDYRKIYAFGSNGSEKMRAGNFENFGSHYAQKTVCKTSKKNKFHDAAGIFRFIFVCVFITLFLAVFSIAVSVFDKGGGYSDLQNYDNIIWPVVMQNPEPFSESNPPGNRLMISASLWDIAMKCKNDENLWKTGMDLIVPQQEVEIACERIFGRKCDFENLCENCGSFYGFDENKKTFSVKPISGTDGFLPHTVGACREGGNIVLNVGYVSPQNQFNADMTEACENKIEKYARYKLKRNKITGDLYIFEVS